MKEKFDAIFTYLKTGALTEQGVENFIKLFNALQRGLKKPEQVEQWEEFFKSNHCIDVFCARLTGKLPKTEQRLLKILLMVAPAVEDNIIQIILDNQALDVVHQAACIGLLLGYKARFTPQVASWFMTHCEKLIACTNFDVLVQALLENSAIELTDKVKSVLLCNFAGRVSVQQKLLQDHRLTIEDVMEYTNLEGRTALEHACQNFAFEQITALLAYVQGYDKKKSGQEDYKPHYPQAKQRAVNTIYNILLDQIAVRQSAFHQSIKEDAAKISGVSEDNITAQQALCARMAARLGNINMLIFLFEQEWVTDSTWLTFGDMAGLLSAKLSDADAAPTVNSALRQHSIVTSGERSAYDQSRLLQQLILKKSEKKEEAANLTSSNDCKPS